MAAPATCPTPKKTVDDRHSFIVFPTALKAAPSYNVDARDRLTDVNTSPTTCHMRGRKTCLLPAGPKAKCAIYFIQMLSVLINKLCMLQRVFFARRALIGRPVEKRLGRITQKTYVQLYTIAYRLFACGRSFGPHGRTDLELLGAPHYYPR